MNKKTQAIVLKTTKYTDNSLIVKLFTKDEGLKSYIVGVSKKGNRVATFQGLNIIHLESTQHGNNKLARIKSAQIDIPYRTIHSNWIKGSVIQFLNELLYQCIKEETANVDLYEFIESHLLYFDEVNSFEPNFHLYFMIKMSRYLGFYPQGSWKEGVKFNLVEGNYQPTKSTSTEILESTLSEAFYKLSISDITELSQVVISSKNRRELLKSILFYFKIHQDGFSDLKSQEILETVFSE